MGMECPGGATRGMTVSRMTVRTIPMRVMLRIGTDGTKGTRVATSGTARMRRESRIGISADLKSGTVSSTMNGIGRMAETRAGEAGAMGGETGRTGTESRATGGQETTGRIGAGDPAAKDAGTTTAGAMAVGMMARGTIIGVRIDRKVSSGGTLIAAESLAGPKMTGAATGLRVPDGSVTVSSVWTESAD
jgi:hypothetical protein